MEIGTHISKSKAFYSTLTNFFDDPKNKNRPVQLFTGSPKFWRRPKLQKQDVEDTKKLVDFQNLQVFIHSIYLINLCKSPQEFHEKAFKCIKWEMQAGLLMGFKGVVIHCGKSLKMDMDIALNNMFENICSILVHTSPTCPLLLETSSGQGSETLWEYDSFKKFYGRFSIEQQERLKICIDTCHVFAAGHDPYLFLDNWEKTYPKSLVLVHFNDSKEACGHKKDRHAFPGEGHVGPEKMALIESWCRDINLPMVME